MKERADVIEDLPATGEGKGFVVLGLANLVEEPRVANGGASDHQPAGAGLQEDAGGFMGGKDIAIGEDRAGEGRDGLGDEVIVDFAAVHFAHGAAVDGEEVQGVAGENGKQLGEGVGGIEADPSFNGERDAEGVAEGAEDRIDALGFAEQAAAGTFAVDDGGGAPEVEVDGSDGEMLQFPGGPDEGGDIITDELGNDRPARGVVRDGLEDVAVEAGPGIDAEVFREVEVGAAEAGEQAPEGQVGDVLHGREGQEGPGLPQQGVE